MRARNPARPDHQRSDGRPRSRRAGRPVARRGCTVYISVPTVDEDAWQQLEPGTAHPLQRLRAVRELVDAGINAGVLMNADRPGLLVVARQARTHGQGDRRSRRALRRLQRDVPRGRHARPLHEVPRARLPVDGCRATRSCTRRSTRRRTTGSRCRGWCACFRTATACSKRKEADAEHDVRGRLHPERRTGRIRLVMLTAPATPTSP